MNDANPDFNSDQTTVYLAPSGDISICIEDVPYVGKCVVFKDVETAITWALTLDLADQLTAWLRTRIDANRART